MKIVFFGTPDFARISLEKICSENIKLEAVVTQPDRKVGRGKKIVYSPVKNYCMENDIKLYQPESVNKEEFLNILREIEPDLIIIVAFGQILKKKFLKIAKKGTINAHASLLPKYRGAAPIQAALFYGEKETGTTIQYVKRKLDSGNIINQAKIPIEENDNFGTLHDKLAHLSADLLIKTIDEFANDRVESTEQNEDEVSYFACIEKEQGKIDFSKSAKEINDMIKAFICFPSGYCYAEDKMLKIYEAKVLEKTYSENFGEIVNIGKDFFTIQCKDSSLMVTEVQLQSKKRMKVSDFLRGCKLIKQGTILK